MSKTIKFNVVLSVDGKERITSMTANVDELSKAIKRIKDESRGISERFVEINQKVQASMQALNGLSEAGKILGDLTQETRSFATAMAEANTMAGKDAAGLERMKEQVTALSKEVPMARDALAKGLYQVISNGVPEDNMLSFLEASARSSVGGIADLQKVVGVTSTVIKNYGAAWTDAAAIQDKIQLTAKNGVTSFEQLADALPRVSGNAATLGVSIDELLASFATLTGVSGNTAEVSTQLAAIFTALVKPSSEAAKMAEEMGIQFDAAAVKSAGGLQNFLTSLDRSVKAYAASSGVLEQEVYAKLFGSAEALRALIPLNGELAQKFGQNVAAMKDSAGTMDAAFLKVFGVTNPIVDSGNDKGASNQEKGGKGYLQKARICCFFSIRSYQGIKERHYEKHQEGNGKPFSVFVLHGFQLFISHVNDRFLHVRDVLR